MPKKFEFEGGKVETLMLGKFLAETDTERYFECKENNPHFEGLLKTLDLGLSPIQNRMNDEEKKTFNNVVMLWMASCQNVAAATVMFTILNKYLLPLTEKLTCLEKSIELIKSTSFGETNEDNL